MGEGILISGLRTQNENDVGEEPTLFLFPSSLSGPPHTSLVPWDFTVASFPGGTEDRISRPKVCKVKYTPCSRDWYEWTCTFVCFD